MILTVTLNPLLEQHLSYKKIIVGDKNRNGKPGLKAGGKGINVSRQLNYFKADNLALTFVGGSSGKIFNDIVHEEKIKLVTVRTKNETRKAAVILEESSNRMTTFFESSPDISVSESEEFLSKLEKMMYNCDTVILSGSSPCNNTDHIFPAAIKLANELDKISVCDTYGKHLQDCINAGPTILHNNIDEIKSSLNLNFNDEKDKIDFLNFLYSKNIRQSFLTDSANPFYCSNFDYHFKVKNPAVKGIDSTGSGDAFVAGIVYGWKNNFTFEDSLAFAVSCGALNSSTYDVCNVLLEEIEELKSQVVVSPVGKKIKLIDVNPH